jgi:glyoxylase-like metal-dependent hydrolase (beta-lactamase superfamily II)
MTTATYKPQVHGIFDPATWTVTYVVYEKPGSACAIIDSVLDYDPKSGRTSHASADKVIEFVKTNKLKVEWILETHAHADHLSSAGYIRQQAGGRIAIGENIRQVQAVFKKIYNLERGFVPDGSQFDHLFRDGETFSIGEVEAVALLVPGHTPADMAYLLDGAVFVGDGGAPGRPVCADLGESGGEDIEIDLGGFDSSGQGRFDDGPGAAFVADYETAFESLVKIGLRSAVCR